MNDEEDINYVKSIITPAISQIESIPGVLTTGITHWSQELARDISC